MIEKGVTRAISIRQPWVEDILAGRKKEEYRDWPTRVRGRVYLYASKAWAYGHDGPWHFPRGVIVGSVEVWDCRTWADDDWEGFAFRLRDPKRYAEPIAVEGHGRPAVAGYTRVVRGYAQPGFWAVGDFVR